MIQPATERRIINLGKIYGSLEYGTAAISVLEIGRQEKKNLATFLQANTKVIVCRSSPRHQSQWGIIVTEQ